MGFHLIWVIVPQFLCLILIRILLGFYDLGEEYMDGIGDKSGPYVDEDTFDLGLLGQGSEFDTTPWFHRRLEAKLIERMCKK